MLTWWGVQAFLNHDAKKVQTRTELSLLKLCRVQPFFERQCKDTPIFRYHQISACDKARFFSTLAIRNLLNNLTRRFAPRNSYFFREENIELSI